VTEVSEIRESHAVIAKHFASLAEIKSGGGQREGAIAYK